MNRNASSDDLLAFSDEPKPVGMNMVIPERIVLSAGYDGDDDKEEPQRRFRDSTAFDDTPLVSPEAVMAGMQTPPSVLTIDFSNAPIYHSEGDGADESATETHKYSRLQALHNQDDDDSDNDDRNFSSTPQRSSIVVGQEDRKNSSLMIDSNDMRRNVISINQRLTILESMLTQQRRDLRRSQNYSLINITVTVAIFGVILFKIFNKRY